MTDPKDQNDNADPQEELDGGNGRDKQAEAAAGMVAVPAGADPGEPLIAALNENGEPKIEMSDELRRALEEAEESVERKKPDKFDPNRVEPAREEEKPAQPSPREMELKMQILELRQELRVKDKEIEQRLQEVKQNAEQARRLQSQLDSYKLRVQKEKSDWFNFGHEPLLKEVVQVLDNLERALQHAGPEADVASVREGVELIQKQLSGVLEKFNVKPVEALGSDFNPEYHQAMTTVESAEARNNSVIEVFQKGYILKDRLLRPAMVVVAKNPAAAIREDADADGETGTQGEAGAGGESDPEA